VTTFTSRYYSDGNRNYVVPIPISYPTGYKFDRYKAWVTSDVPIIFVSGYENDGAGTSIIVTVASKLPSFFSKIKVNIIIMKRKIKIKMKTKMKIESQKLFLIATQRII